MRSVFFILAVYMLAPSISWTAPADLQPALTKFFLKAFTPVVGDKKTNMKYKVFAQDDQLLLVIEGQHQGISLSRYTIRFTKEAVPFAIPKLQMVTKQLKNNKPYAQLTGELTLSAKKVLDSADLKEEKNLTRLLLRADPLLLPQLNAPGLPAPTKVSLTDPQQTLLTEVQTSIQKQRAEGKPPRALIYLPTGIGKTVLAALTTKDQSAQQIFFVVENKEVLREATDKFIQLLGIPREDTAILTGDYDGNKIAALKNKKVVSITRTGLFNALDRFAEHLDVRHTPATFIFDEAQHLGRKDGQFDKIISAIEQHIKPEDLILGLSATPWHVETDFVRRFFSPYIFSMFLTAEEREQVLQNKDLVQLSMTMVLRAMSLGYINPIFAFDEITTVPDLKETSVRALLKRDEMALSKMTVDEATEHLKKQISVHQPLLLKMLHEIVASVDRSEEHTYYWNRGLIFVPSIAHANVYAYMLNRLRSYAPNIRMEFEAYHSKLDRDEADKVMDWFKDEQVRGDKYRHKYLIVVKSAGEGFDFPAINHLITAKPYNKEDQIGVRELLQNLGRATRLAPFKTQLRVTDFTGDMRRLFAELDPNLIRTFPALESTLKSPAPAIVETEVVITQGAPKIEDLVTETVDVSTQVVAPSAPKNSAARTLPATPPKIQNIYDVSEAMPGNEFFDWIVANSETLNRHVFAPKDELANALRVNLPKTSDAEQLSADFLKIDAYYFNSNKFAALTNLRFLHFLRKKDGAKYLFGFDALSDKHFEEIHSTFTKQEFDFFAADKTPPHMDPFQYTRHNHYHVPGKFSQNQQVYDEYYESLVASIEQNPTSKLEWLKKPIAAWPEAMRVNSQTLNRSENTPTKSTQVAMDTARVYSVADFLIKYYNEDFVKELESHWTMLAQSDSPLLITRSPQFHDVGFIFIINRRDVRSILDDLSSSVNSSLVIALYIFSKFNYPPRTQFEKDRIGADPEFRRILRFVQEMRWRAHLLGIHTFLTHDQVEKLKVLAAPNMDACEKKLTSMP